LKDNLSPRIIESNAFVHRDTLILESTIKWARIDWDYGNVDFVSTNVEQAIEKK
jgi:hypothetical protein